MFKGKLLALAVLVGAASPAYAQTVRAVFEGDLSIVDPHASTVYITRNLSNLTYDALFVRESPAKSSRRWLNPGR